MQRLDRIQKTLRIFIKAFVIDDSIDVLDSTPDVIREFQIDIFIASLWFLKSLEQCERFGAIPAAVLLAYKVITQYDNQGANFNPLTEMIENMCYLEDLRDFSNRHHITTFESKLWKLSDHVPCRYSPGVKVGPILSRKRSISHIQ